MPAYAIYVLGPDGRLRGELEFTCDGDRDAANVAFGTPSRFGHELWIGDQFLGWFAARPAEVAA